MSQDALFEGQAPPAPNGRGKGLTSRQQLTGTIKSVRDLLRTDAGLYGDTDRLPQLTWLLFLKFLDDHELAQQDEWGAEYAPVVEPPYRWRDWAATGGTTGRLTGDELIAFVN